MDGTSLSSFKVGCFALTEGMEIFKTIAQIDHTSFVIPTWRHDSYDLDSFVNDVQSNLIQNEHDTDSESTSSDNDEVKKVDDIFQNLPEQFRNLYTSCFSKIVPKHELLIRICDLGLLPRNLFGFSDPKTHLQEMQKLLCDVPNNLYGILLSQRLWEIPSQIVCYNTTDCSTVSGFHFVSNTIARKFTTMAYSKSTEDRNSLINIFLN